MFFTNFLCLLFLMVLSNSHTIYKSIDTNDGIDEVSDTIINLDNIRHHRIRRDRIHPKYRIQETPTSQFKAVTGVDVLKPAKSAARVYSDIITVNDSTPNLRHRSRKRKIGGLWRKFRGKNKATTTSENAQKRQVVKGDKHRWWKRTQHREPLYINPENRKKNSFIFIQPEISSAKDAVAIDMPKSKKNNNVKFLFTPYVMYATELTPELVELMDKRINKKTTENMITAIAKMNTQINHLKKIYGPNISDHTTSTASTTYDYPGTVEIEEILTGIKMKAIQTVVDSGPSMVNVISNTVTETTFGVGCVNNRACPYPRFAVSTLNIDNILNNDVNGHSKLHHLVARSATTEPLSISTIEDMLQKEIKNIYHKMKSQVAKELPKIKQTFLPSSNTTGTSHTTTTITPLLPIPIPMPMIPTATPATPTPAPTPAPTLAPIKPTTPSTTISSTRSNATSILSPSINHKSAAKFTVPKPKTIAHLRFRTTSKPPSMYLEKSKEKNEMLPVPRLVRNDTPTSVTPNAESSRSADNYNMLNIYERMLEKVQEENSMRLMATSNLPLSIQKRERYRLSKRNPETLTDIELQETVQTQYNDGIIIPDYEYVKSMSSTATEADKEYETKSSKSYEDLSKKIAYDDFVNGYKHYLKFQQEKAKADNFSAMVKYQAHRHHNVDDIGKYILDKIPQLPQIPTSVADMKRLKRFFEDVDMEDQETSTKTDDSWFRKHFYVFLDYGPPKKFHTSQIVALKPPIADLASHSTKTINYKPSSRFSNLIVQGETDGTSASANKETTVPISLDDLTRSLDAIKNTTSKSSVGNELENTRKYAETTTKNIAGFVASGLRGLKIMNLARSEHRRESIKCVEAVTKPVNATVIHLPDRPKRANECIAEDFAKKDLVEKSSTPVREVQADVAQLGKSKSENRFGCVDVNLVPVSTHAVNLHVNNTRGFKKKNKFRDFLKRFHFKSKKSKKHTKRSCTNRSPRFNPFKSIKNIFRPSDVPSKRKLQTKRIKSTTATTVLKEKLAPLNFDIVSDKSHKYPKTNKLADPSELQREIDKFKLNNFNMSEPLKTMPPFHTHPAQSEKPLTFLMMLDDGKKHAMFLQPDKFHRTTHKIKSSKRPTTVKTKATKKMAQVQYNDDNELLSVNVKTLKPLPSVVMKALTSTASNETLPDLNLEIAKLQYGISGTNEQTNAPDMDNAVLNTKSGTHAPLAKPVIEGLTFKNQLTRIAKLSLPFSKLLGIRQNMNLSEDFAKTRDYHMAGDYLHESPYKADEVSGTTKRESHDYNSKNVDYFNDLLLWNDDILNIDKVPHPQWKEIVKNVEKDFGTTEYTTPNMLTMMNELKELDMSYSKDKKMHHPQSQSNKNIEDRNLEEDVIRRVAMNDKALLKSRNLLIKGEQEYFQYNRPNLMSTNWKKPVTIEITDPDKFNAKTMKAPFLITAKPPFMNSTVSCPFAWSEPIPDEPTTCPDNHLSFTPPEPLPNVWSPEKHIAWSSGNKSGKVTWTIQSPITWTEETTLETKPAVQDRLAKIVRKFYIGGAPKFTSDALRPMRLSSTEDYSIVRNNGKPKKNIKSAKTDEFGISAKAEKSVKLGKHAKSSRTGEPTSVKIDKFTDLIKDFNTKETPALMVDTTLLSYDDEVETVTNGLDVKKLSRNSQNPIKSDKAMKSKLSHMSQKSSNNIIAKTSKRPLMYYSTPLPMKPSDFNKFLKEQGMDVESVISPLYGQTRLYHSWTTSPKPINFKKTASPPGTPHSTSVTRLSSLFSKYSTQMNKLRHKPVASNKFKSTSYKGKNKNIDRTEEPMAKNTVNQRHENDKQASNLHNRIKKLKLFRQKIYDVHSTKSKEDSGSEEKFSAELQAKLEHLQEPKPTVTSKSKPKSNPLPTFEPKLDTKPVFGLVSKSVANAETYPAINSATTVETTMKPALVSTLEPEPDDAMSDLPLELSGSIIFTSEDPRNKDVDITIINFDDMTKANGNDIPSEIEDSPQYDERLEGPKNYESVNERRLNCRRTTKSKSDSLGIEGIDSTDAYQDTMYTDVQLEDPIYSSTAKRPFLFYYLDKLQKNQAIMNPKRVQISSHHYKYDIFYKNPDNPEQSMETQNQNQQQYDFTTKPITPSPVKPSTLKTSTNKNKYNTLRKGDKGKKLKRRSHNSNRKWITIDSRFRYVRNIDIPVYSNPESEKEKISLNMEDMVGLRMKKGFFGFSPKIYIKDKLNLKRMNTPMKKNKTSTATKTTMISSNSKKTPTTTEATPSTEQLYKPLPEYKKTFTALDNDKKENIEGFSIKIGHQRILDAVDKIKSMTTDDMPPENYDIKQGFSDISEKLGFLRKNYSEDFNIFIPPGIKENPESQDNPAKKDSLVQDSDQDRPLYLEYPETLQDTEHDDKTADQKAASRKFEQSIFDKSMYGKKQFDQSAFEKAVFGTTKIATAKPKTEKTYSNILTDIMSYDITPDNAKINKDVEYNEGAYLPDHVNVDPLVNTGDISTITHNEKGTTKKNYIFDSASIIFNKSYLNNIPNVKLTAYETDKKEKTTEKPWLPVVGNTLSVLFRNPLEGHLGFGLKPVVQSGQTVTNPKPAQGMTMQMPSMPTPMEIMQAQLQQRQMMPTVWPQMPYYQNNWPQMQAASMGFPQMQTGVQVFSGNETYGIYMEPGVFNYDYNQPSGLDLHYVGLNLKKKNARPLYRTAKNKISEHTVGYRSPQISLNTFTTFLKSQTTQDPNTIPENKFTMCMKSNNKKFKDTDKGKYKSVEVQNIPKASYTDLKHNLKRDLQAQDTYTAKDVAALEVIVDLMKNTLGYEEKDLGSMLSTNLVHPMKSIHQVHDSTNSIQVHIAIPYDMQNSKKRSPLEPVRVRKVFSAKMSTPVDLEYQVHSFEGSFQTPTTVASSTGDGLSPGMYLLIDRPKNGYALKPVKTNIDFAEIKSRQAGNVSLLDFKGQTTPRDITMKNVAKVTLSKNFISAVNKQLVELYENLTKRNPDESSMRMRRYIQATKGTSWGIKRRDNMNKNYSLKRAIDWAAVKRYFGNERVCDCKCKANKPMCRACAASDAVIEELTFEFDNIGKYMQDHCTEIQTYFWMNPSGGLKLRDAVDRIDANLRDYYKRSKGKCKGRTCETLGCNIEKKRFLKSTKVVQTGPVKILMDDLISVGDDLNTILAMKTCYNEKLIKGGEKLMHNINSCISRKAFEKRSDAEATKKFVKNVYSLDNINVNIICNPEISSSSTESFETSTAHNLLTLANSKLQEHTLTSANLFEFDFENFKNQNKRKGLKRFFLKRNNKKDKLFTYFTTEEETKASKMPFKRAADIPIIADSGGTFWLEYLRAATVRGPYNDRQTMIRNEPRLDVAVTVQEDEFISKKNKNSTNDKAMNAIHGLGQNCPIMTLNKKEELQTTTELSQNFNQLLNLFEKLQDTKENINQNDGIFSNDLDSKPVAKMKSSKPPSQRGNNAFASSKSIQKATYAHGTSPLVTKASARTTSRTTLTSSTKPSNIKSSSTIHSTKTSSGIIPTAKTTSKIIPPAQTFSDNLRPASKFSDIIPQANISSKSKAQDTIYPDKSPDSTNSDRVYQDSILSDTMPPDNVMSETIPTDSDIMSTDSVPSDTLSQDTEFTDTTPSNSTDTVSSDDVSSIKIPSYTIFFQEKKPLNNKPSVIEESKPQESFFLPRTSSSFLLNFNRDSSTKTTSICPLIDIEHILNEKKNTITFLPPTTTTKAKFKFLPFFTIGNKDDTASTRLADEYYATTKEAMQTTNNNSEADLLRADMIKEAIEMDQNFKDITEKTTPKSPITLTTKITSTSTKKTTRKKIVKQGFLQRITSATKFLGLTNNFYLLRKTNSSLVKPDVIIDQITSSPKVSTPVLQFGDFSVKSMYGRPTVVIINDYDRLTDNLPLDRNTDKYKNLLLSIIQYETNNLNDEWQKIAYANENNYGYKRSVTKPSGTSWKSTIQTNAVEEADLEEQEQPKKKGLLNKLARRMGLNVVSAKKKAAHSPSKFSVSSNHSLKALTDKMSDLRQTTSAAFCAQAKDKVATISPKEKSAKRLKLKKAIKTAEASQVYPPSHTVCDLQATYNHVAQRCRDLEERTFEAYVKDVPCHMYKRLQRSFLITHKTRTPTWDWIRNKRSSIRFDKHKNSEESNTQYYDKYETFVKDDDGIYRVMDRKKRDASRAIDHQLRSLPPLKPRKSELYVMAGDLVALDCPLQPQRSPYSQYTWGADPKDLLDCDNVHVDGFTLVIRKAAPRNAGRYSCTVDDVVRTSTKVAVMALPVVDVVFLPTYRTQQECNYDDLKAIQQLGREMSRAARCGSICSIRIDEPMCQRDTATNRSLIRSTGILTMSPQRVKCSVQCRRDLFSSMLRLAIANIPSVVNTRVVLSKDGVNETLKPWDRVGRPITVTHTLRKKDSSGHFEYHKFSSVAEPGQLNVVTLCHPGFYLIEDLHICAPCPANTSAARGANRCSRCAAGAWAAPGAAECCSVARRLRRYDWWWYPPCGYVLAFVGLVCACGVCVVLALIVHLGSKGIEDRCACHRTSSACLERTAATKPHVMAGYMNCSQARPLSPSRVILARFFKQSLPSSRGTVVDSQETRFELWKEKNIPPLLPAIDFDIDTS